MSFFAKLNMLAFAQQQKKSDKNETAIREQQLIMNMRMTTSVVLSNKSWDDVI